MALSANGENPDGRNLAAKPETPNGAAARGAAPAHAGAAGRAMPGLDRGYLINEQVHTQGGMTPLLFAARQGYTDVGDRAARRRRRRQPAQGRRQRRRRC